MSWDASDGEPCSVYRERIRRARKQHKCSACGLAILPGHLYSYTYLVSADGAEEVRRCGACETTFRHLWKMCMESDSDLQPDMWLGCGLDYAEEWGAGPPDEIAALPFMTDDERGRLLEGGGQVMSKSAFSDQSMLIADLENLAAAQAVLSRRVTRCAAAREKQWAALDLLKEMSALIWKEVERLEKQP